MSSNLRPVPDADVPEPTGEGYQPPDRENQLPLFEGLPVKYSTIKLAGGSNIEMGEHAWKIDEVVTVVLECRVTRVGHDVKEGPGDLFRQHTLKVTDAFTSDIEFEKLRVGL